MKLLAFNILLQITIFINRIILICNKRLNKSNLYGNKIYVLFLIECKLWEVYMLNKISLYNVNNSQIQSFKGHEHAEQNNLNTKQKATILASSALGMTPVIATLAHRKGFSLNPVRIAKTPIKDWAIFKYSPKGKYIHFGPAEIIATAIGSVVGGFIGGSIVDKDNISAKKREVVNQVLGNVLVPVGCVGGGAKIYKKYADKIESIIPQIKSPKQSAQIFNKVLKSIPNGVCTLGLLGLGLYLGNKVSNFLNEHIYHKKVDRNMKFTDCAPHVDDVCMAVSMMNEDSPFAAKLERVIPLALLVPGYETGTAREH